MLPGLSLFLSLPSIFLPPYMFLSLYPSRPNCFKVSAFLATVVMPRYLKVHKLNENQEVPDALGQPSASEVETWSCRISF